METITFKVSYKRDRNSPQHTQEFNHEQAALAFAFSIEVDGGIAVLTKTVKREPLSRPSTDLDFYS